MPPHSLVLVLVSWLPPFFSSFCRDGSDARLGEEVLVLLPFIPSRTVLAGMGGNGWGKKTHQRCKMVLTFCNHAPPTGNDRPHTPIEPFSLLQQRRFPFCGELEHNV